MNNVEVNDKENMAKQLVDDLILSKQKDENKAKIKDILSKIKKEDEQIKLRLERIKQIESTASYRMAVRLIGEHEEEQNRNK